MSDEEKTAVEETKAAEEEKAEVEGTKVEEKAVEEVKVVEETKVEEKVKAAPRGGGSSDDDASEEAVEMLKAALPETLPLGTVLKINRRLYYPNKPGTPSVNIQIYVIGLPDGDVGMYNPEYAEVDVVSYDEFIEILVPSGINESLESAWGGCAMPPKDSTRFVANITVVNSQDK